MRAIIYPFQRNAHHIGSGIFDKPYSIARQSSTGTFGILLEHSWAATVLCKNSGSPICFITAPLLGLFLSCVAVI